VRFVLEAKLKALSIDPVALRLGAARGVLVIALLVSFR
jgi:hypothetical protein